MRSATEPPGAECEYRAILADEDQRIGGDLRDFLRDHGIACEVVADWADLDARMAGSAPDIVLLPQRLGCVDVLGRLARFRAAAPDALMIVKGADASLDRGRAFDLGADDVLARFMDRRELAARLRAHLRRRPPPGYLRQMPTAPLAGSTPTT
jgi:DNA-binding response OmpR family regulator